MKKRLLIKTVFSYGLAIGLGFLILSQTDSIVSESTESVKEPASSNPASMVKDLTSPKTEQLEIPAEVALEAAAPHAVSRAMLDEAAPERASFSVSVPTRLPVAMDLGGNVMTADNGGIENRSASPVRVTDIRLVPKQGWRLLDFEDDVEAMAADTKGIALSLNNAKTEDGSFVFDQTGFPVVNTNAKQPLVYAVKIPRQKTAEYVGVVAEPCIIVGQAKAPSTTVERPAAMGTELDKDRLAELTKDLTGEVRISKLAYRPEFSGRPRDISKAQDGSVICVLEGRNATIYGEGGVLAPENCTDLFGHFQASLLDVSGLDTRNTTNMMDMFICTQAKEIVGLSSLDTSLVKDMRYMFCASKVEKVDLSSFDTKSLQTTECMFHGAVIKEADLSGFDLSHVENTKNMFAGSKEAEVVCDTEETVEFLEGSENNQAKSISLS